MKIRRLKVQIDPVQYLDGSIELRVSVIAGDRIAESRRLVVTPDDFESHFDLLMETAKREVRAAMKLNKP